MNAESSGVDYFHVFPYNINRKERKSNRSEGKIQMKSGKIFTLLELLIVIAIIAILVAMLLPALNSARKKAGAASCVSLMKQHGTAVLSYTGDSGDCFPPGYDNNALATPSEGTRSWINILTGAQGDNPNLNQAGGNYGLYWMRNFSGSRTSFKDPGGDWRERQPGITFDVCVRGSYSGNIMLFGVGWNAIRKTNALVQPSVAVMEIDTRWNVHTIGTVWGSSSPTDKLAHVPFDRHGGRINAAYADGHIGSLSYGYCLPLFRTNGSGISSWLRHGLRENLVWPF